MSFRLVRNDRELLLKIPSVGTKMLRPTPVVPTEQAKKHVVRAIVTLDASPGPYLYASHVDVAKYLKDVLNCNLARALQVCRRLLTSDAAFLTDRDGMIGLCLLDRDCVSLSRDPRIVKRLKKIVYGQLKKHVSGQFFVPSRARASFIITYKVRETNQSKIDWYLSYDSLVGKPIRSFVDLERHLAENV